MKSLKVNATDFQNISDKKHLETKHKNALELERWLNHKEFSVTGPGLIPSIHLAVHTCL